MMFKRLFFLITLFASSLTNLCAQTIADARAMQPGSTVTVRGIVTNGPELGKIRYLQDGTAGIAAFPGTGSVPGFDGALFPGDSVEITGTMVSFHELLEITPITAFSVISTGHPLPTPQLITVDQISEDYESQLVALDCVTFNNAGGVFNSSGSYTLTDTSGHSAKAFLRSGHPMIGTDIPSQSIRFVGVLSQYDNYQLLPRTAADFQQAGCFFFTQLLEQSDISPYGFSLSWKTSLPTSGTLLVDTVPQPASGTGYTVASVAEDHIYQLTGLTPGTIYWVQIMAQSGGGTILSDPVPFATQSLSTGQIKVFFNHSIDPFFSNGNVPDGTTMEAVRDETIARINAAQKTLDIAVYNNNRSDITNAIQAAQARGVRVRYIAAEAASNPALDPPPAFPVLYGNTNAIMHNKFMVIDAHMTHQAWVMSGSLNWTTQNMTNDFNNTLFIQDESLAKTYELEFEEMWGGKGGAPDTTKSRFGAAKRNDTPHHFLIGNHPVESYFSPSDQTSSHIESVLRSAQVEALFGAFSFTKNELGDALIDVHDAGVSVRGIMENISDIGAEYDNLLSHGVNVRHHYLPGDFHHKYGVVDALDQSSDPTVVTGSHNWSFSAETINDENTLILHDPAVAALFKSEFEERWIEFPLDVQTVEQASLTLFPNPATQVLRIQSAYLETGTLQIKNTLGQVLISTVCLSDETLQIPVADLVPGTYFITFSSAHAFASLPFQKI